jgi:hypothetical protein
MFLVSREQLEPRPSPQRAKHRWEVLFEDLSLFASLCLAWLVVVRTLRRERKERAARLKLMKLVKAAGNETLLERIGKPQC